MRFFLMDGSNGSEVQFVVAPLWSALASTTGSGELACGPGPASGHNQSPRSQSPNARMCKIWSDGLPKAKNTGGRGAKYHLIGEIFEHRHKSMKHVAFNTSTHGIRAI